ncbi:auxin-induced protein 22E-like [Arachis stenosperma]|uniref:auxin-induced protein 22E-like n=1 Tax=Arachis stenosperma TaxID=217475 RepID=UPI0025ABF2E7|nr:auxin-induced protein 22E-like [Arachis stenosperma]
MEPSIYQSELNLEATELRLGLPGRTNNKRSSPEDRSTSISISISKSSSVDSSGPSNATDHDDDDDDHQNSVQPAKVQVVGWPPVRSFRRNSMQQQKQKDEHNNNNGDGSAMYVKVSMAGAPYLRKIDLNVYNSYSQLLNALQNLFKCTFGEYSEREGYNGSDYAPTYEDKDGDWMLVGDVPWDMFTCSCKRLRIVKGSEAKGLASL